MQGAECTIMNEEHVLSQQFEQLFAALSSLAEPNFCQDHILGIFIWFISPFFLAVLVVVLLELFCFATRGRTAPGLWKPSIFSKKEREWRRRILEFCFPEFEFDASKQQSLLYCVICQQVCQDGELLRQINCAHVFHSMCISIWVSDTSNSCPLCRCPVLSSSSTRTYREYLARRRKARNLRRRGVEDGPMAS